MNETSVAITALSVNRLASSLPNSHICEFGESICTLDRTNWSDPRNLAQVCFTIGSLPFIPNRVRTEALTTWISTSILAIPQTRFKVKDLVQILTGYSSCRVRHDPVLAHLEQAVVRYQLQYCDPVAIGAICLSFSKLEFQLSSETVGGLVATAAQQTHSMNAQSLFGIVRGLSGQTVNDQEPLRQIFHASIGRLGKEIPIELWGDVITSCKKFATNETVELLKQQIPEITGKENISAIANIIVGCDKLGMDVTELIDCVIASGRLDKLDRSELRILNIVSKYRQGTFSDWIGNFAGSISQISRVSILLDLLDIMAEINCHEIDPKIIDSIVNRLCEFPTELADHNLGRVGHQVWAITGNIPPQIKRLISSSTADQLAIWVRDSEPSQVSLARKVYVVGEGVCKDMWHIFPNPPVFSLPIPNDAIAQFHELINSIDPLFLRIHRNVTWFPISYTRPSMTEKNRACNQIMNDPDTIMIFVPPNTDLDKNFVADTMHFIASQ